MKKLSTKQFFALLRRRNRRNAAAIDRRIEASGLEEWTVLMADASGFTRRTREYGILQFLAVMTQCQEKLMPVIRRHRGICISHGADNILAVFRSPEDAVRGAVAMQRWLRRRNRGLPDRERFNICIGIDVGPVIRLTDNLYGATVNAAAKIGEDLAGKDEILVTRDVAKRVRARTSYSRSTELGGRTIELFRVR